MNNIQEIARQNKLNLMEISILVRLYEEHPNMMSVNDLMDDGRFFFDVKNGYKSLVRKGIVKMEGQYLKLCVIV